MITFLIAIAALLLGYTIYGKIVERIFGIDENRKTPAKAMADGVDYVELSWPRAFLIQFLNIAGLGPIFGAIAGALWGPVAFLWIVLGSIFAGATHDYLAGMMSVRNKGATIAEIIGEYLGMTARQVTRVFSLVLLLLVGVVFMMGPADILSQMTGIEAKYFVVLILVYYILATMLPIDKVIARIYPVFGSALLIMGFGIGIMLLLGDIQGVYNIPELTFENLHPKDVSIFPFLFITIACGAISGFHATQSPLMARCMANENEGRKVFYGSMIAEGVIAMIWAAAAMTFFGGTEQLAAAGSPGVVVNNISTTLLGSIGGALAILGVVACPITSGDSAFRSARLGIADAFKLNQSSLINRFIIASPLFTVAVMLTFVDFNIIWRYFAWSNQVIATITLWTGAMYLVRHGRFHWIATLPATFMTSVVTTYIIIAPEGLQMNTDIGYPAGFLTAAIAFGLFIHSLPKARKAGEVLPESI